MPERNYWLSLFNKTTWQEFLDAGGDVVGFPETRQKVVSKIKPGDYLLAYMTGISCWVAVLEVTDAPYDDLTRIWKQALFPCRVNVRLISSLEPDTGIPALSLSKELRMFDNLKVPQWGLLFRIAPKALHPEDGQLIAQTVQQSASPERQ